MNSFSTHHHHHVVDQIQNYRTILKEKQIISMKQKRTNLLFYYRLDHHYNSIYHWISYVVPLIHYYYHVLPVHLVMSMKMNH